MNDKKVFVTQSTMPLYEEYVEAIRPLWDSRWLTNMGQYHQELEEKLRNFLGVDYLSLIVNGHMALELIIQAMDFPEGAEIITTPFTFVSTTHAIIRNRLKPIFCDIKLSDGTIDETKIENLITKRTVAIMPVHVYGNICNIEKIQQIADKYGLKVIYDAAHAFGVKYKGRGIGSYGDASVFSFHATKVYHTIEGGAVTFSDSQLYEKLYNLKNFGIRGEELVVTTGVNAKMNEFSAIMGLCNLKHINSVIKERKLRDERYRKKLENIKGVRLLENNPNANRNYGYFPIVVEDKYPLTRDELYDFLKENRYFTRKYFYPLTSKQKCFKDQYKKFELRNAEELSKKVLALPLYENLDFADLDKMTKIIESI